MATRRRLRNVDGASLIMHDRRERRPGVSRDSAHLLLPRSMCNLQFNLRLTRSPAPRSTHDGSPLATFLLWTCVTAALSSGCSKQKIQEALEEAKAQTKSLTESTVQAIEDKLPESGSLTLETTPTTTPIGKIDLELIEIGDGRPNVVQIASYDLNRPGRSFPAILLHGSAAASTASSLVGETIACDVYYQQEANAPIAMTKPGHSVSVTFDAFNEEESVLRATLGTVELLGSDDQTISIRGGQLVAVVRRAGD